MEKYLVKNKKTNKYYNFISNIWTAVATYGCLIEDLSKLNDLLLWSTDFEAEVIPVSNHFASNESVIDEVLVLV